MSTRRSPTRASRGSSASSACSTSIWRRPAGCSPTAPSSFWSIRRWPRAAARAPTGSSGRGRCFTGRSTRRTVRSPRCFRSASRPWTATVRPTRSRRRSVDAFETFPEQTEAKRLLRAALAEGPAHAYLFHGLPGVGKRAAALAFAAELIREPDRVQRGAHPDVYLLEPVGDQIRIDAIRELRRDL